MRNAGTVIQAGKDSLHSHWICYQISV